MAPDATKLETARRRRRREDGWRRRQPLRYGSRRTRPPAGSPVAAAARSKLGCMSVRGMWRGVVRPVPHQRPE
eukprot:3355125-Prymnesium_polylepis.1